MRKVYDNQFRFGQVDIAEIQFDKKSRDELPRILQGLQYIYVNEEIRQEVFKLLESIVPLNTVSISFFNRFLKTYFVIVSLFFLPVLAFAEETDTLEERDNASKLSFSANFGLVNESFAFGGGLRWRTHGINYMSRLVTESSTGVTNKNSSISLNLLQYFDFNPNLSLFLQGGLIYEKYTLGPNDKDGSPTSYDFNAGLGLAFYFNNITIASGYSIFSGFMIKFGVYT